MTRLRLLLTLLPLAALALGSLSASAAPAQSAATSRYFMLLSSNRDGDPGAYSMRTDGSRLAPLLPRTRRLFLGDVAQDGSTVGYYDPETYRNYISRADGTHLRRISHTGTFSRDGKLIAFERGYEKQKSKNGVWIVGADGRGLRRISSARGDGFGAWSPDAKTILLLREVDEENAVYAVVVQPLHGKARVVARGQGVGRLTWSPDGRWIAYSAGYRDSKKDGLYLVHPDGTGLHRIAEGFIWAYAWSPNGRRLAVTVGFPNDVAIVGADGRGFRRLHLRGPKTMWELSWSPDGRVLAFDTHDDDYRQDIWVVGPDGRGLHALTHGGANRVAGWTRLAPRQPAAEPLLPSERVLDANTVATRRPVTSLSADGSRVAFIASWTGADCDHIAIWTQPAKTLERYAKPTPCRMADGDGVDDVELAGKRAAWVNLDGCGNNCYFSLHTAALGERQSKELDDDSTEAEYDYDYHVHGAGDLLVYNAGGLLMRIGVDGEAKTIRRGVHACCADSVADGLIAVREHDAVAILDGDGRLLRVFPFAVAAARLDAGRLVVAHQGFLESYDLTTGALVVRRDLPGGYTLDDVDGGIALLHRKDDTILVLRLDDGRSFTVATGAAPRRADIEPAGLYYSYTTADREGRVVLMTRDRLIQRLAA